MLPVRAHRVMEPRRCLEDETAHAAGTDEAGQRVDARHGSATAPDLRAQPVPGEVVEPNLEATVEWRLDVHLSPGNGGIAGGRIDERRGLDRFDADAGRNRRVENSADRRDRTAEAPRAATPATRVARA